jgi:hypothetical protein
VPAKTRVWPSLFHALTIDCISIGISVSRCDTDAQDASFVFQRDMHIVAKKCLMLQTLQTASSTARAINDCNAGDLTDCI